LEELQIQLEAQYETNIQLRTRLEAEMKKSAQAANEWEEWATRQFSDENTLYIVLDADGHPQSWDEIVTHLQAISEASGADFHRIEAGVFDAPREPNDKRFEQWMRLRNYYRAKKRPSK